MYCRLNLNLADAPCEGDQSTPRNRLTCPFFYPFVLLTQKMSQVCERKREGEVGLRYGEISSCGTHADRARQVERCSSGSCSGAKLIRVSSPF